MTIVKINDHYEREGTPRKLACPICKSTALSIITVSVRKKPMIVKIVCNSRKCKRSGKAVYDVIYGALSVR